MTSATSMIIVEQTFGAGEPDEVEGVEHASFWHENRIGQTKNFLSHENRGLIQLFREPGGGRPILPADGGSQNLAHSKIGHAQNFAGVRCPLQNRTL